MRTTTRTVLAACGAALILTAGPAAWGNVLVQCPGDTDGDAIIDTPDPEHPRAKCMHVTAGDGYVRMGDGSEIYTFGFSDVTGLPPDQAVDAGMLAANFPAPTIVLDEDDELYLTLTNVGMMVRNDLFDAHVVHFHGFPNAATIFDGVPDPSIGANMGSSITYYYSVVHEGTFMWHCHVEAVEHMQMGMLGNLYVRPRQNRLPAGTDLNGFIHQAGTTYAYNDGDGSTRYDVEQALQLGGFDKAFHEADETFQPLPFLTLHDDYPMINGRGYPDTANPLPLAPPVGNGGIVSQPVSSLVTAQQGQRILIRLSSLDITRSYTVRATGLPLLVVAKDAKLLRGPTGLSHYYTTSSLTLGGGESYDAIIDTAGVPQGTYFLYTTNLNYLSNYQDDFGGMMTEIVVE
jgi:FtsP/CotA-like multicopper oxidase with cupredoxin domain